MRIRTAVAALAATVLSLALSAPAMAAAGEGWAGETNDKVVTFFCLGVLLFFVLVVSVGTLIQSTLDKRKYARQAAAKRQRVGW